MPNRTGQRRGVWRWGRPPAGPPPGAPGAWGQARRRGAFTLVELIVVMMIIGLLMALLAPTVSYAIRLGLSVGAQTRVDKLANGVKGYKMETGYYPAQDDTSQLSTYTGSQILAARLFGYTLAEIGGSPNPTSKYSGYEAGETLATLEGKTNTLSDGFWVSPMAICYYVSWPGQTGAGQFQVNDNSVYTNAAPSGAVFATFITNPSYSLPYNDGTFLLISAGADRKFFNDDDATNWKKTD